MRGSSRSRPSRKEATPSTLQNRGMDSDGIRWRYRFLLAAILGLLPVLAAGQTPNPSPEGVDNGNYNYQGSFEFGYRFVNTNGSQPVYDTFVNQQQGPRLLEQTLSMRSLNHEGVLFDSL